MHRSYDADADAPLSPDGRTATLRDGDRFTALRSRDRTTPDRHRTLEAVIAWSWDLLSAAEQRALAWLSVFQDGFDRATAVCWL